MSLFRGVERDAAWSVPVAEMHPPFGDLEHFDEVAEHSGVGELFTTGWLEMAL